MIFKDYNEVLKLHERFTEQFQERITILSKELPKSPEAAVAAKRAAIKQAQEAIKSAQRTREDLVKRADARVAQHQRDVARLTHELDEIEKVLKHPPKPKKAAKAK